jgi:AmmeMemoRadiSam system protein B
MKVRLPCQAGAFYEEKADQLKKQIKDCFLSKLGPGKLPDTSNRNLTQVVGLICPHAGYVFSGPVAAHSYYRLAQDGRPDSVVIFGPNHTGYGSGLSIVTDGVWRTPLGDVEIDGAIAQEIVDEARIIDIDDSAHKFEHSIEVQLPFLQFLYGSRFKFVPICFLMQDLSSAREVGTAVGRVLTDKNAVIIASSDMTHYQPQKIASTLDGLALKSMETMDEATFHSTVEANDISACGYGPIAALITAVKVLGGRKANLLCYETSGDVSGDYSSVVGYAAVCFTK